MNNLPITNGQGTAGAIPAVAAAPVASRKGLDLAVIKKGAKDFLDFMDATKEVFYAYLYHRTGSVTLAQTLLSEVYLETLSRAMSLWWFGSLSLKMLLESAEHALRDRDMGTADLDTVYLPNLQWLSPEEKKFASTFHDSLWTLPKMGQEILILSLLVGLPDERIAAVMNVTVETIRDQIKAAKDMLVSRWQPTTEMLEKLNSLVFVPSLDLKAETKLRFGVVEKYNSLRFRRYQWVVIGGLFAVMSNVIVASVLAFAVVVQPPSSLQGTRSRVASLDAVLLRRQLEVDGAKRSISAQFKEAQRIAAFDVSRDFTSLGLAAALESLRQQQDQEAEVNRLIKLMERAKTAMVPLATPVIQVAMSWLSVL